MVENNENPTHVYLGMVVFFQEWLALFYTKFLSVPAEDNALKILEAKLTLANQCNNTPKGTKAV